MDKTILAPGIILYKTDPKKVGDLLHKVQTTITNWNVALAVNTSSHANEIISARQCYDYALASDIMTSNHEGLKTLFRETDEWISPFVSDFVQHYSVEEVQGGPYVYLKYETTNKFDFHVDDGKKYPRTVSVSAYLNEDYDGGEIEFNHFGVKHKPSTGDVVVFGSSFPYMHRVTPTTSGTRYAIVNWYRYRGYPEIMA